MATERGTIVKIDSHGTWVKTSPSSACAGCSARGSCHSRPNDSDMEVNAINEIGIPGIALMENAEAEYKKSRASPEAIDITAIAAR